MSTTRYDGLRREGEHVPGQMPKVYEGDRPYIFVCYAHADRDAVLPIIRALVDKGYRVWYDDGIELATDYPKKVADHVYGCAFFVMFVSRGSLRSKWCNDEVNYALDLPKSILPVYLEDVELTRDLRMRMGQIQAMNWYEYSENEEFCERLFAVKTLESCLGKKGKRNRVVKLESPESSEVDAETDNKQNECKNNKPKDKPHWRFSLASIARIVVVILVGLLMGSMAGDTTSCVCHKDGIYENVSTLILQPGGVVKGIPRRDKLDDYKWDELKLLSRAIAAARNNEDWLVIAKYYSLVDEDGKLKGDEKVFTLSDGTRTSMRILGFRHDELVSGGRSGISFEFADAPVVHQMNENESNAGGWEKSEMRAWLNADFLSCLPDGLQSCIEAVKKETNNVGQVEIEDDTSMVTASAYGDKLWLLSMPEVYGSVEGLWSSATHDAEGTQYQLYIDKGVVPTEFSFCSKNGLKSCWWLRSPGTSSSEIFLSVGSIGGWGWHNAANDWGVSPGFCF